MKYISCPRHRLPYKANVGRSSVFPVRQHLDLKSFIKRKFLPTGEFSKGIHNRFFKIEINIYIEKHPQIWRYVYNILI